MDEGGATTEHGSTMLMEPPERARGIVVDNIVKTYRGGKVRALDGLSLKIAPGEALGLVGPNGAGKTTLLGCLLGFLAVNKGTVTIDGYAPDDLTARARVGYLPERLTFDRWMTGRDYLQYHHELSGGSPRDRRLECEELLKRVELDPASWSQPVRKYSRGMLQRLGFAQALVGKPDYLLMDEPTSGMDPAGVLVIRRLLQELRATGKMTILLNSHQLDQIERSCDRVAFIAKGKVVSYEDLHSVEKEAALDLDLRWLVEGVTIEESTIGHTVLNSGCEMLKYQEGQALVKTPTREASAKLLKALIAAGVPLIQASPDSGRLERKFLEQINEHERKGG